MRTYSTIFLLFLSLGYYACSQGMEAKQNEPKTANITLPELLDRSEKIQLGTEWDYVQNFYGEQNTLLAKNPNDNAAKLKVAELFVREARVTGEHGHYYPAALKLTKEILADEQLKPDLRFQTLVTRAGVQLSLHEFAEALATANEAIVINNKNARIFGVLVDCYVELGEYDNAIKMADKMVTIKPDIRSYSRVSYVRELHGDVEGAKQAMQMAIRAGYPGYEETAWAMQTLGELYMQYGDLATAENIFDQILEMRADYPFAVAALGELAYQKGDFETAEKRIDESINIIPEVGFYLQRAQLQKDQNRTEEFSTTMSEVFEMLADDEAAGHNMNLEYAAIYKDLLNDLDKSLEYAQLEYQKRPENIDVNRLLTQIYVERDEIQTAQKHLDLATSTNSKHPDLIRLKKQI